MKFVENVLIPLNFFFFLPEPPICLLVADNWINSANLPFSLLHVSFAGSAKAQPNHLTKPKPSSKGCVP